MLCSETRHHSLQFAENANVSWSIARFDLNCDAWMAEPHWASACNDVNATICPRSCDLNLIAFCCEYRSYKSRKFVTSELSADEFCNLVGG